jgi:hypothetical protein
MTMYNEQNIQQDSASWIFFVKLCFAISVGALGFGIFMLPVDIWMKGYLMMGSLFTVGSTITMSKTLRDQHEAQKLIHKISNAKTEKILKEFEINGGQ